MIRSASKKTQWVRTRRFGDDRRGIADCKLDTLAQSGPAQVGLRQRVLFGAAVDRDDAAAMRAHRPGKPDGAVAVGGADLEHAASPALCTHGAVDLLRCRGLQVEHTVAVLRLAGIVSRPCSSNSASRACSVAPNGMLLCAERREVGETVARIASVSAGPRRADSYACPAPPTRDRPV